MNIKQFFNFSSNRMPYKHLRAQSFTPPTNSNTPSQELFGFRGVSGMSRIFSPIVWTQAAKAGLHLNDTSPIARRMNAIPQEGMQNAGLKIETENEAIKILFKEWWENPFFGFQKVFWDLYTDYLNTGDLIIPVAVNEVNGRCDFGFIDPFAVSEVKLNPGNPMHVESVVVSVGAGQPQPFEVIAPDPFGILEGDIFYFRNKKAPNEVRGYPALTASADLLELQRDNMFKEAERWAFLRYWILQVQLDTSDEGMIEEYKEKNFPGGTTPPVGSIEVTNKDVEMKFLTPGLNSRDGSNVAKTIKGHIFGGEGYPAWFFGEADGTNVATAREMMRPTLWKIMREVRTVTDMLSFMFSFVVQKAALNSRFTMVGTVSLADAVGSWKLKFNNIYPKELLVSTAAVKDLTAILIDAVNNNLASIETARRLWVDCLGDVDVEIDLDQMIEELDAAEKEAEETNLFTGPADDEGGLNLTPGESGLDFNELMRAATHGTGPAYLDALKKRKARKVVAGSNGHTDGVGA